MKCPVPGVYGDDPMREYLIHSYLYYKTGDTILSDQAFDELCAWILKNYDKIDSEWKPLVEKGALKCSTYLKGHYPSVIILYAQVAVMRHAANDKDDMDFLK